MKRRILISFSMGRTSGRMLKLLLDQHRADPDVELACVTANTSQEDPRSLEFGANCQRHFNYPITLVQAKVRPGLGEGTTYEVVQWHEAANDGSVFEAVIGKYGIPNKAYPHCNRELKLRPIHAYVRTALGWEAGSYETAIGIRADEVDRVVSTWREDRLIYPLIGAGIDKAQVLEWWSKQPFDLETPEILGNCTWCWKKTLRKHLTLARDHPEVFDFPRRMEATYPFAGRGEGPRRMFRQGWTTLDIFARAQQPFDAWHNHQITNEGLDAADGCAESCDIYSEPAARQDLFDGLEDAA